MDSIINRWILEFLLMSSIPDSTLKRVLKALPFPEEDSHLAKLIALKSMQSEFSAASISETSLECIVMIANMDGFSVPQSMKEAYCAVAVECAVKHIDLSPEKNRAGLFFDSFNSIWKGKMGRMFSGIALGMKCELFTPELITWQEDIGSALWDVDMCEKLVKMNTRQVALDKVGIFLKETWASIGPSFLEIASEDELVHEMSMALAGVNEGGKELVNRVLPSVGEDEAMDGPEPPQNIDRAIRNGKQPLEHNHAVPSKRACRGVKFTDSDEAGPATVCSKDHNKSNIQVEQSQKSLRSSSLESQQLVKDTLPDALHESDIVGTELVTKGMNHEPAIENQSTVINVPEKNTCQSTVPNQPFDDSLKK